MATRVHPSFASIGLSKIVQISEKARLLAPGFESRTGQPFIYFQRGEVGYPLPPFVLNGLQEAIEKGLTKYPKSGGESFYKQAVVDDLTQRGVKGLTQDHILATMGGQEGLQLIYSYLRTRACAGFTPCWSCMFDNIFPFTETSFVPVPLRADDAWSIDWRALERTLSAVDSFYFNSPHNPTGRVFSRDDVTRLAELCAHYGVLLVVDEAYRDLAYTGTHFSPLQDERFHNVISVNTFSKALAATGFRIGFAASRRADLIEMLTRGEYTQTAGVPTPIQYAFSKALASPERTRWADTYRAEMLARGKALADHLHPDLRAHPPEGAFYAFINLAGSEPAAQRAIIEESATHRLLENGVAVVPGSAFGSDFTGYARLSFSTLPANIVAQGAARFSTLVLQR
ncbi:MAG: pyridoxal phosphate-dependent aminotransferase [Phycisphaerales bacterium]